MVKEHHLHILGRLASTQPVERQAHRCISAWIAGGGELVGKDPQYSRTALVPGLNRPIIMDHDTRCVIAVDTLARNVLDRQSGNGLCLFWDLAVFNTIWSRLKLLVVWLLPFQQRVRKS